jgi:hypothetical protein
MSALFQFTVTDTFLIEGRGLILSPSFPVDRYHFNRREQVRIEAPDGRTFETDADFEIPCVRPTPKVFEAVCVIRRAQKADVPVGSKVFLLNKTAEQVASPNGARAEPLADSGVCGGPPSVS